jgi:hypothetical protein
MSLFDAHFDATVRIAEALVAAEAIRTTILIISELHTASLRGDLQSAGLSSIARASFGVQLWLRRINLGLKNGRKGFHIDHDKAATEVVGDSTETTTDVAVCTAREVGQAAFSGIR